MEVVSRVIGINDIFQLILVAILWVLVAGILMYPTRWIRDENRQTSTQIAVAFWPFGIPCLAIYALVKLLGRASRMPAREIVNLVKQMDRAVWMATRKAIDQSEFGILWEGRMPYGRHIEVEVKDSTGNYLIPVDPDYSVPIYDEAGRSVGLTRISTARDAVAWTYGLSSGKLLNPVARA
jgi:hypothetical protein